MALAEEVVGEAAGEGALGVGGEEEGGAAGGGWDVVGAAFEDVVEYLAVVGGDVFDVGGVFETAFDFEGCYARIYHGTNVLRGVEVFEGEEVFFVAEEFSVGVVEVVGGAAGLGAAAAIAATLVEVLAHVALSAEGDAEGAVDEGFEGGGGEGVDLADLAEGGFAGEDDALEAYLGEELDAGGGVVVGLGGGVEFDGWEVALE